MATSPRGWFITGTDTGVGKTLSSSALLEALGQAGIRAIGMKPIASGAEPDANGMLVNDDVARLQAASRIEAPASALCPYLFRLAIAPHLAAVAEGREIALEPILATYAALRQRADIVVVEGVGGFRVPLGPEFDTADLAQALDLPVILVVGMRLGCINHALLTVEAIQARGLKLAGWIASSIDPDMLAAAANLDTLHRYIDAPLLGHVPYLPDLDANRQRVAAARHLDLGRLLGSAPHPLPSASDVMEHKAAVAANTD